MAHGIRLIAALMTTVCATALQAQSTSVRVAIIGTGDIANSIGPRLAMLGHTVIYGSRDPDRAEVRELVRRTGGNASATSQRDAAERADVVILAVPWTAMEQVIANLGDVSGRILVDISNPVQRGADGYMESMVETSAAERIQSWAPGARVVKAGVPSAYLFDDPDLLGTPPTVLIAADDRAAKETVAGLVHGMGLEPFDAGPLRLARAIESFGLLLWVPLLQGRAEGVELRLMHSSYLPCVWDVVAQFGPTADAGDLASFPRSSPPVPCEAWR